MISARLCIVLLLAAFIPSCGERIQSPAPAVVTPAIDDVGTNLIECDESEALTVLMAKVTIHNVVTNHVWEFPLRQQRLDADGVPELGSHRIGGMAADGVSKKTGKGMGYGGGVNVWPSTRPAVGAVPAQVRVSVRFYWTDEDGRHGTIDRDLDVDVGSPGKHQLSDDVTVAIEFRKPVKP